MRRFLLLLLCAIMFISSVSAIAPGNGDITITNSGSSVLSEDIAEIIALLFVNDMTQTNMTCWDSKTSVVSTTKLYNPLSETEVVAYSFDLTNGYVVVSAYPDVPNVILE